MDHVPNRLGVVVLGSALLFAGCSGGAGGGASTIPANSVREKTSFVTSVQDELNASHGFPSISLHAQLGIFGAGNRAKLPASSIQRLIYSGDFTNSDVTLFSTAGINPPPLGQISSGLSEPERLFVDANQNLYATNLGNSSITEYAPGGTTPILTITNGVNYPTGLTVDSNGTVYCANVGNNTITEYPAGQTTPSVTINLGSSMPEYLAIGPKGALYASILEGNVLKFAPGSTTGNSLNLQIGAAGALEVDKLGNVIAIDENTNMLDIYKPGRTAPARSIATGTTPFAMALNKAETQLYISSEGGAPGWTIQSLVYPTGKAFVTKMDTNVNGWPLAVGPDTVF